MQQKQSIDAALLYAVVGLVIFGMIMISSVSVYPSFKITSRLVAQGLLEESSNSFYLAKNIAHVLVSFVLLWVFSKVDIGLIERQVRKIFFIALLLLFLVLVIGSEYNGAKGWLNIPGLPSIQPVEFAKLGLLLYIALFIKKRKSLLPKFQEGFLSFFGIVGSVFLLLMLQPDFGSILILAPVAIALYFVGGGNIKYLGVGFGIFLIGATAVYGIGKLGEESKLGYISGRIDNFFQSTEVLFSKANPDGKDYQIKQGLLAIGSGGFSGLGFGKSIQKFGYLPEVQGDFIFSVIAEELGFLGVLCLLSLYLFVVYRIFLISRSVHDLFAKYVAFGIGVWIAVQFFVNIGVNLNVIPLTGVTLPFVSYGGSSLISLMLAIGIVLSISRYRDGKSHSFFSSLHSSKKRQIH